MSNFITLNKAIAMTETYRKQKENILALEFQASDILPLCETFDRASFDKLLSETDCTYIRIYLGMDDDLKIRIVAVAADSKNMDILPAAGPAKALNNDDDDDDGGSIVDDGNRCPTACPPPSPLNP